MMPNYLTIKRAAFANAVAETLWLAATFKDGNGNDQTNSSLLENSQTTTNHFFIDFSKINNDTTMSIWAKWLNTNREKIDYSACESYLIAMHKIEEGEEPEEEPAYSFTIGGLKSDSNFNYTNDNYVKHLAFSINTNNVLQIDPVNTIDFVPKSNYFSLPFMKALANYYSLTDNDDISVINDNGTIYFEIPKNGSTFYHDLSEYPD